VDEENVLTKEIAEQFVNEAEASFDLWEFTAIDDAAAEILSRHEESLYFHGLPMLSDTGAASLGENISISVEDENLSESAVRILRDE